jgi:hypothetical protein
MVRGIWAVPRNFIRTNYMRRIWNMVLGIWAVQRNFTRTYMCVCSYAQRIRDIGEASSYCWQIRLLHLAIYQVGAALYMNGSVPGYVQAFRLRLSSLYAAPSSQLPVRVSRRNWRDCTPPNPLLSFVAHLASSACPSQRRLHLPCTAPTQPFVG